MPMALAKTSLAMMMFVMWLTPPGELRTTTVQRELLIDTGSDQERRLEPVEPRLMPRTIFAYLALKMAVQKADLDPTVLESLARTEMDYGLLLMVALG